MTANHLCVERIVESLFKAEQREKSKKNKHNTTTTTTDENENTLLIHSVAGAEHYFQLCGTVCDLLPSSAAKRAELSRLLRIWEEELLAGNAVGDGCMGGEGQGKQNEEPSSLLRLAQLLTTFTLLRQLQLQQQQQPCGESGSEVTGFPMTLSERKHEERELSDCISRWNAILFALLQFQHCYQQQGHQTAPPQQHPSKAAATLIGFTSVPSAPSPVSTAPPLRWGQLLTDGAGQNSSQPSSFVCCLLHGIALLVVGETTRSAIQNNDNNTKTVLQQQHQRIWVEEALRTVYYAGLTASEQQRVKAASSGMERPIEQEQQAQEAQHGVSFSIRYDGVTLQSCSAEDPIAPSLPLPPPTREITVSTAMDILTEITRLLTRDRPSTSSAFSPAPNQINDDETSINNNNNNNNNDDDDDGIDEDRKKKQQKPKPKTRAERRAAGNGATKDGQQRQGISSGARVEDEKTNGRNNNSATATGLAGGSNNNNNNNNNINNNSGSTETSTEKQQAMLAVRIIAGILHCLQRGSMTVVNHSMGDDDSPKAMRPMPLSDKMNLSRRVLLPLLLSFAASPTAGLAMRGIEANVLLPLLTALANQGGEACLEEVIVLTAALFDFLFRIVEDEGIPQPDEDCSKKEKMDFRYTPFLWETLLRAMQYAIRGGSSASASASGADTTTTATTTAAGTLTEASNHPNNAVHLDAGRQINMQLRVCYLLKRLVHWTSITHPKRPRQRSAAATSSSSPSSAVAITRFHPLFEWNPHTSPQAWDDFFLVMETANEFNLHIILPVLKRLDALVETNLRPPTAEHAFSPSLHPQWIEMLLLKLLKHPNTAVRKVVLRRMWQEWPQIPQPRQQPQQPQPPPQQSPADDLSSRESIACSASMGEACRGGGGDSASADDYLPSSSLCVSSPVWYTHSLSMPFLFYDVFLTCADPRLCSDLDRLPVSATFLEMRAFEWEEIPASPASEPIAASVDRLYTHLFCDRLRDRGPGARAEALRLLLDAVQAQQSRFALSVFARLFAAVGVALYEEAVRATSNSNAKTDHHNEKLQKKHVDANAEMDAHAQSDWLGDWSVGMILDTRNLDRFLHVFHENMPFWLEVRVSAILFTGLLHLALIRPEACRASSGFWRLLCHCGPLASSGGKITSRVEGAGQVVGPATGAGQEMCFLSQYVKTLSMERPCCSYGGGDGLHSSAPSSTSLLHRLLGVPTLLARTQALLRGATAASDADRGVLATGGGGKPQASDASSSSSFRSIAIAVKEHFFLLGALAWRGSVGGDANPPAPPSLIEEDDRSVSLLQSIADCIMEELLSNLNRPYCAPERLFTSLVAFIEFHHALGDTIRYHPPPPPPPPSHPQNRPTCENDNANPSTLPLLLRPMASACTFFSASQLRALVSNLEAEALETLASIFSWYQARARRTTSSPADHHNDDDNVHGAEHPSTSTGRSSFWVQLDAWEALVAAISSTRALLVHHDGDHRHRHHGSPRGSNASLAALDRGEDGVEEDPDVVASREELFTKRLPALFAILVKVNHQNTATSTDGTTQTMHHQTQQQTKAILLHHTLKLLQSELSGIVLCHSPPSAEAPSSSRTTLSAFMRSSSTEGHHHLPCYAEDAAMDQQRWWQQAAPLLLQPVPAECSPSSTDATTSTTLLMVEAYLRILMDCLENSTLHHALVHQQHRYQRGTGSGGLDNSCVRDDAELCEEGAHRGFTATTTTTALSLPSLSHMLQTVLPSSLAWTDLLTGLDRAVYNSIYAFCPFLLLPLEDRPRRPAAATNPGNRLASTAPLLLQLEDFALNQLETCWSLNLPCVYDILVWLCGLPFPSSPSELENDDDDDDEDEDEEVKRERSHANAPRLHRQAMLESMILHATDVGAKQQTRLLSMVYGALRLCLPHNPNFVFSCLQQDMTVSVTVDRTSGKKKKNNNNNNNNKKKSAGSTTSAAGGKGQSQRDVYYAAATVSLAVLQHYASTEEVRDSSSSPTPKTTAVEEQAQQHRDRLLRWWVDGFRPLLLHWAVFYSAPRDAENESTQAVTESVLARHWPEAFRLRYPASVNLALLGRTLCISTLLWVAAHHPTLVSSSSSSSAAAATTMAEELTMELLDMNTLHPVLTSEPCMPNSETHRTRMRVWQLLCALQPLLFTGGSPTNNNNNNNNNNTNTNNEAVSLRVMEKVCAECVPLNNLGSVRRFMEVYCIRLLHAYPRLYRVVDQHLGNYRLRPQVMGTYVLIAGHALLDHEERRSRSARGSEAEVDEAAFDVLFPRLLQQSTSHQHLLRIISHVAIYRICNARIARLGGAVEDDPSRHHSSSSSSRSEKTTSKNDNLSVLPPGITQIYRYITDADEHIKFREKHEAMLFYDTEKMASPRSLFCLQRKEANMVLCDAIPASMFERMQYMETEMTSLIGARFAFERLRLRRVFGGEDVTVLLRAAFGQFPHIPHTPHVTNCCTDYTTEAIEALWSDPLGEKLREMELHGAAGDNVQRKTVSWWTSEVHNELHPRALGGEDGQPQQRRHSMVMVASLLENPVNVAGLCRCGDIFAIEELVISETAVFDHPHFVAVARSAERWVPWRAVPPAGLPAYLASMRAKGYTIVGIEQTTQSVSIEAFDFPLHCVLVLGSEGQGIPPPLIPLLDVCVEIPQYGLVRSLNVHVTGAVAMYEYTLQQIMSKAFA